MPLLRPRTVTPARLAANRANAQRSTGPRTARGKAWSRLNALRTGGRSEKYAQVLEAVFTADLGTVERTAAELLTPEELAHPVFAALVEGQRKAHELIMEYDPRYRRARRHFWERIRRKRMGSRKKPKTRFDSVPIQNEAGMSMTPRHLSTSSDYVI